MLSERRRGADIPALVLIVIIVVFMIVITIVVIRVAEFCRVSYSGVQVGDRTDRVRKYMLIHTFSNPVCPITHVHPEYSNTRTSSCARCLRTYSRRQCSAKAKQEW